MAGPNQQDVRYEPDDRPPLPITIGLGVQYAILCIASIVLTPMVMITVAGGSDEYLSWAVFAALVISGLTTAIQARKVGRIGAGYILVMGSTSAFLAVSVSAIEQGGPAMLATLDHRLRTDPVRPGVTDGTPAQGVYADGRRHRADSHPDDPHPAYPAEAGRGTCGCLPTGRAD